MIYTDEDFASGGEVTKAPTKKPEAGGVVFGEDEFMPKVTKPAFSEVVPETPPEIQPEAEPPKTYSIPTMRPYAREPGRPVADDGSLTPAQREMLGRTTLDFERGPLEANGVGAFNFGKKVVEWAETETEEAKDLEDWVGRVFPESAKKLGVLIPKFLFHDLPRPFTDAVLVFAKNLYDSRDYTSVAESRVQFSEDIARGIWTHLNGMGEFMGQPMGLYGWESFRHRWLTDPAGSMAAIVPMVKGAYSGYAKPAMTKAGKMKKNFDMVREERSLRKQREQANPDPMEEVLIDSAMDGKRGQEIAGEGYGDTPVIEVVQDSKAKFAEAEAQRVLEEAGFGEKVHEATGLRTLEDGTMIKDEGGVWKTKASANNARLKLKEEGITTEVVEAEGGWGLKPFDEAGMIDEIMAGVKEKKQFKFEVEDIFDAVDREIKNEVNPVEIGMEKHPFRQDRETTAERTALFDMPERQTAIREDIDVYSSYQVNNVNRWIDGENLDIGRLREALDDAANNAGQLRKRYTNDIEFNEMQGRLQEAAAWARDARRPGEVEVGDVGVPKRAMSDAELAKIKMARLSDYDKLVAKEMVRLGEEKFDTVMDAAKKDPKASAALEMEARASLEAQGILEFHAGADLSKITNAATRLALDVHKVLKNAIEQDWKIDEAKITAMDKAIAKASPSDISLAADLLMNKGMSGELSPKEAIKAVYSARYLKQASTKFHAGINLKEIADRLMGTYPKKPTSIPLGVKRVEKVFADVKEAKKATPLRKHVVEKARKAKRQLVDTKGNIKADILKWTKAQGDPHLGNFIANKIILSHGGGARAAVVLDTANKSVYRGLKAVEREALDQIIFSRRVMQIDSPDYPRKGIKHPGKTHGVEYAKYLEKLEKKLGSEKFNELWGKANSYFDIHRMELKKLFDEGIITQKTYENLKTFDWQARKAIESIDPEILLYKFGTSLEVRESGIVGLKKGKTNDLLETDSKSLMLDHVSGVEGRIMKNRANQAMAELGKRYPDNPYVRVKKPKGKGWTGINYREAGKNQKIYMPNNLAKDWLIREAELTYDMAQIFRVVSGSSILRPMATGINPAFAFSQVAMDIAHIWLTSDVMNAKGEWKSTYNPVIAPLQMGKDIGTVLGDAVMRDRRYLDFIEDGGGMEWMQTQGRVIEQRLGKESKFTKLQDILGYPVSSTEIMSRLMLRERAIKQIAKREGVSVEDIHTKQKYRWMREEASAVARDYLDFGQSGSVTKTWDSFIPYLNAQVQATRGLVRTGKRNYKGATAKVGLMAAPAIGLYLATKYNYPELMKDIDEEEWDRNFIIPLPVSFEDENGRERHAYLKFKKDPGQRVFYTLWESMARKMLGEEVDGVRIAKQLTQLSPATVTSLPPTLSATLGYATNTDFWHKDEIWKGPGVENPREEYRMGVTPEAMIDLGAATNLSPARMDYMLKEVFTSGNIYSDIVGAGYKKAFSDMPKELNEQHWAMELSKSPIARKFFGLTRPFEQHREVFDEEERRSNEGKLIMQRQMDFLLDQHYVHGSVSKKEISMFVKGLDSEAAVDWADQRWRFFVEAQGMEERDFWLKLHRLDPEARARVFKRTWDAASEKERASINREMGRFQGLFTERFRREHGRLEREGTGE